MMNSVDELRVRTQIKNLEVKNKALQQEVAKLRKETAAQVELSQDNVVIVGEGSSHIEQELQDLKKEVADLKRENQTLKMNIGRMKAHKEKKEKGGDAS